MFRVGLVLSLRVQVEKNARIGVIDRFYPDPLSFVIRVFVILVDRPDPHSPEPSANSLLESVVVCFFRSRINFIGAKKPVTHIGQGVIPSGLRNEIGSDPVVAVFVYDPNYRQMYLVDFKLGTVRELLRQVPFPLRSGDGVKPPVLKALKALVVDCLLDFVKLRQSLGMDPRKSFGLCDISHSRLQS